MKNRTIYITDLDGTLLRKDQSISQWTVDTINAMTEKGLLFSFATARSYATAGKLTEKIHFRLPVIVFNGTFILEPNSRKRLLSNIFTSSETDTILNALLGRKLSPVVNAFMADKEKFSYLKDEITPGIRNFLEQRKGDIRNRPVSDPRDLYQGEVFHVVCIDDEEKLLPVYNELKNDFACVLFRDIYDDATWLEIHPKNASKANAILALKEMLGCDKIVCFGDGKNDVSMFELADECYAVANAEPELKTIATAIIESNEADGVAKWLSANAKIEKI